MAESMRERLGKIENEVAEKITPLFEKWLAILVEESSIPVDEEKKAQWWAEAFLLYVSRSVENSMLRDSIEILYTNQGSLTRLKSKFAELAKVLSYLTAEAEKQSGFDIAKFNAEEFR